MEIDEDDQLLDDSLANFPDYNSYLDAQMTEDDLFYLEDQELARQLIEVGYHGKGEILSRQAFREKKEAYQQAVESRKTVNVKTLAHVGCESNIEKSEFLKALKEREEGLRNGRTTCILFIRDQKDSKNEKSAYIDLAHRMKQENFTEIFSGNKTFQLKKTDLSYFDWMTGTAQMNESPNFRVQADGKEGLLFRNKRDRKMINVNPNEKEPGDFTTRKEI